MLYFSWPPGAQVSISGNSTAAKQDSQITLATATNTKLDTLHTDLGSVATSANQTTANTSLASIDTKLTSQSTAANQTAANTKLDTVHTDLVAVQGKQDTGNTSLASIDTKLTSQSTAANQTTANTSLSSIDTKLTSQSTAANQTAQSTLFGAVTETAPASDTASSGLNGRLQRIAQRLTSLIALLPTTLGQKLMSQSLAVAIASDQTALLSAQSGTWTVQPGNTANTTAWLVKQSGKTAVGKARNDYTSTGVTTGAYVQLVASTASAITEVEIFDSSGQTLVLATGAAASEVDQIYILPGGNGRVPLSIAAATRISVKAVSAAASVGELTINFYG